MSATGPAAVEACPVCGSPMARGRCWDSIYGDGLCSIQEIEVVLDD